MHVAAYPAEPKPRSSSHVTHSESLLIHWDRVHGDRAKQEKETRVPQQQLWLGRQTWWNHLVPVLAQCLRHEWSFHFTMAKLPVMSSHSCHPPLLKFSLCSHHQRFTNMETVNWYFRPRVPGKFYQLNQGWLSLQIATLQRKSRHRIVLEAGQANKI